MVARIEVSRFPLFHWPSTLVAFASKTNLVDSSFCAAILAVCALASARHRGTVLCSTAEANSFLSAVQEACVLRPTGPYDFNLHRACLLLVVTAIQDNKPLGVKFWLGQYLTLCSVSGLHEEGSCPSSLGEPEKEERKRCVRVGFQLEEFCGLTYGRPVRHRGSQIHVNYPAELDDEDIGTGLPAAGAVAQDCPLHGWDRTTDLYRILELALNQLRVDHQRTPRDPITLALNSHVEPEVITCLINSLYEALPSSFKEFRLMEDSRGDNFQMQAVNLLLTLQNIRLLVLCSSVVGPKDTILAGKQLFSALATVPPKDLIAMSRPMYNQLAGIAMLLCSAIGSTREDVIELRQVVSGISDLLDTLNFADNFPD